MNDRTGRGTDEKNCYQRWLALISEVIYNIVVSPLDHFKMHCVKSIHVGITLLYTLLYIITLRITRLCIT